MEYHFKILTSTFLRKQKIKIFEKLLLSVQCTFGLIYFSHSVTSALKKKCSQLPATHYSSKYWKLQNLYFMIKPLNHSDIMKLCNHIFQSSTLQFAINVIRTSGNSNTLQKMVKAVSTRCYFSANGKDIYLV